MLFGERRVKCPDGQVRTVLRNPDKAFALYVKGNHFAVGVDVDVMEKLALASLSGETRSRMEGLLMLVSRENASLLPSFRAAYLVYHADPCAGFDFLMATVGEIISTQNRISQALPVLQMAIDSARAGVPDTQLSPLFRTAASILGSQAAAAVVDLEVKAAVNDMRALMQDGHADPAPENAPDADYRGDDHG